MEKSHYAVKKAIGDKKNVRGKFKSSYSWSKGGSSASKRSTLVTQLQEIEKEERYDSSDHPGVPLRSSGTTQQM